MNARPDAWLRQAQNDLELAQLAKDNGFFCPSLFLCFTGSRERLEKCIAGVGTGAALHART